jgi:hypothetical protein
MPDDVSELSLLFFLPQAFHVRALAIKQVPAKANFPRRDSFMMHSFAYENLDKERRISKSPEILSDNSKTIKKYENTGTPT